MNGEGGRFGGAIGAIGASKWIVAITVMLPTLIEIIDTSVANVALDHIRGSVGATLQEITWIATGFALANVVVMPLTGFLGRLFGQKRVYMSCLVIFLAGSALCGMARSLTALVAFRFIQGLGAGALQPTEQAILRQTWPLEEQGMAMALFGMAVMLGPAIGPTLGGYIVDNYSWPWIFYINIPVGILGLSMVWRFVKEPEQMRATARAQAELQRKNMDWWGITLLSTGLAALQYVLEEGQRDDWFQSRTITALTLFCVFALAAFVIRELSAKMPAVNLRLFKDPAFMSGTLIGSLMFMMLMANMFLLPVFMQEILGFTALQSGMALMPRVAIMMVATPLVGRIFNYVDARIIIAAGVVFFAFGSFEMSHLNTASGAADVVGAILIQGVGFSCLFVPLTTTALARIPIQQMTDATGLNSLFRQIGGSVGLAIFATLLGTYATDARASLSAHLSPTRPEVFGRVAAVQHALMGRGLDAVSAHTASVGALFGSVMRQAMVLSFDKLFLLAGLLFLLVLPLLFFLKTVDMRGGRHRVHVEIE